MAVVTWVGHAESLSETHRCQITAADAATTYEFTLNGKTIGVAGDATGVNETATALANAINSLLLPDLSIVTATTSTDTVLVTTIDPDDIVTPTFSVSGGTGTISTLAKLAGSSKRDIDNVDNYAGGAAATTGDSFLIDGANIGPGYNLDMSALGALGTLTITRKFSAPGEVGLPEYVEGRGGRYRDARDLRLKGQFVTANIGWGEGTMSNNIRLDFDVGLASISVESTGTSSGDERPLQIKTNHLASILIQKGGDIELGEETANSTLIGSIFQRGGSIYIRRGVKYGTADLVELNGDALIESTDALGTLNVLGGTTTINSNSGTTYTNVLIDREATVVMRTAEQFVTTDLYGTLDVTAVHDFSLQGWTTLRMHRGSRIIDPNNVLVVTNLLTDTGGNLNLF
jgi:hypothetical protein